MENEGEAHLTMEVTKMESSLASDLASLNLTGSKGLEVYSVNNDSEEKKGQGYATTSGCLHPKPRDEIRDEWLNLEVSYSVIKDLTDNFSESLVIGKGGFGKVYLGKLGGRTVAIKILDSTSTQGQREFFQEIEVLHKMRHPNLVKLVGACFEKARALVYEYLPNGSLEDCLRDCPKTLTWQMRTRITFEICSALSYLHSKSVIHADLKPANVLLDANFKSKISDFGLCRLLPGDMVTNQFLETGPMGTLGYTDPWFLERCILRPGSDLYSLGIIVLKLLTGMSPIGLGWKIRETNKSLLWKMIDPTVENWPFELAKKMIYWSLQCCFHNENSSEVLKGMSACLQGMLAEIDTFQEPEQTIRNRSGGLEPSSPTKDKEVIGATNPPSSSSSSKPEQTIQNGSGGLEPSSPTKDKEVIGATNPPSSSSSSKPEQTIQYGSGGLEPSSPTKDKEVIGATNAPSSSLSFSKVDKHRGGVGGKLVHFDGPFKFKLDDLLRAGATSTYGKMYVAALEDGKQVAVKRLKADTVAENRRFEKGVKDIGEIRHANLLALRAYYYYSDPKVKGDTLLVFDFAAAKGSLATFLHDRDNIAENYWPTRIDIAIGIARGLKYLHGWEIIHGSLTSSNILIDENDNAKISDYEHRRLMTSVAINTAAAAACDLGYKMSYQERNRKADVYSLGVIILELLTRIPPSEWPLAAYKLTGNWIRDTLDPRLMRKNYQVTSSTIIELAMKCVDNRPGVRPDIQQVLHGLEEIRLKMAPK